MIGCMLQLIFDSIIFHRFFKMPHSSAICCRIRVGFYGDVNACLFEFPKNSARRARQLIFNSLLNIYQFPAVYMRNITVADSNEMFILVRAMCDPINAYDMHTASKTATLKNRK